MIDHNISIPTKKIFKANREQAFNALYSYIYRYVFPSQVDRNGFAGACCSYFLENPNTLDLWLEKHGEILHHKEEFKNFCIKCAKAESSYTTTDAIEIIYYKSDNKNNDTETDELDSIKEPITDISDILTEKEIYSQEYFRDYFNTLPEKIKKKFQIFFISVYNFIYINADKSFTDMPLFCKEKRIEWEKIDKQYGESKNIYEKKVIFLWDCYYFWKLLRDIFPEWILKDQKKMEIQYEKLCKELNFKGNKINSSREKKNLTSVVLKFFEQLPSNTETEIFKEKCIQSVLNSHLQTELQPLPDKALTIREQVLNSVPSIFSGCEIYNNIRFAFLAKEIGNIDLCNYSKQDINDYLLHKNHCPFCQKAEDSLRKTMQYRYGRLKEIVSKPIYQKHIPAAEPACRLTTKQLVSYYKERFKKIPCNLHRYYLALAYKQNGEKEKTLELLQKNNSENLRNIPYLGDVIAVYCACGKEEEYTLNALRAPKIAIGRFDEEEPLDVPQINICQPDGLAMSRDMLSFTYDFNTEDWQVFPKHEQTEHLWYITQDKLFELLKSKINAKEDILIDYKSAFKPFTEPIYLSDLGGIGIFKEDAAITFNGKPLKGISHPLLGKIPFGWYVEVKAHRRNKTIVNSFAEKSFTD